MLKILFLQKGHATLGQEWTGLCQNEDYARVYYIENGEAEIWHHGKKLLLIPGNLYLIPPKSNMRHRCLDHFKVAWLHFNIYVYGCIDIFNIQNLEYIYTPDETENVHEDMLQLLSIINKDDMFNQLQAKSLFLRIISHFFSKKDDPLFSINHDKISRLLPVIEYIDSNLGKPITLAKLAKLAAYESSYFSTIFKQVFTESPIKYVLHKRIDRAQVLLRNSDLKLTAIAEELGFVDAFHFSKTFKKITGETPSDFRNNITQIMP